MAQVEWLALLFLVNERHRFALPVKMGSLGVIGPSNSNNRNPRNDAVLADNLVRINADAAGTTAGCLSWSYRPQHWPTGKNRPAATE
jgi:hypothetical protein